MSTLWLQVEQRGLVGLLLYYSHRPLRTPPSHLPYERTTSQCPLHRPDAHMHIVVYVSCACFGGSFPLHYRVGHVARCGNRSVVGLHHHLQPFVNVFSHSVPFSFPFCEILPIYSMKKGVSSSQVGGTLDPDPSDPDSIINQVSSTILTSNPTPAFDGPVEQGPH